MIHIVKSFSIIIKTEVDVFLELPSFLYDSANISDLIFVSSSFLNPAWMSGSPWLT